MFRTDINHFLQTFDNKTLYWFMEAISALGTVMLLTLMIYILIAGIDFKKGMGVANIFLYTLVLTLFLKDAIDYPRPLAVDTTLNSFGRSTGNNNVDLQPINFWELFSDNLLTQIRSNDNARLGLPSGHTSFMVALTLGCALLFRKKWLWYLSASLVVLTMVSRMYLAQHYLGDVLGGLAVSGITTIVVYMVWRELKLSAFTTLSLAQKLFFVFPLVLLLFSNYLPAFQLGALIGFNIALLVIYAVWGMPLYSQQTYKRIFSVLIFFVLGYAVIYVSKRIGLSEKGITATLAYSTLSFTSFIVSAGMCFKLKLWSRSVN